MYTHRLNKNTDLLLIDRAAFGIRPDAGVSGYLRLPLGVDVKDPRKPIWRLLLELTGKNRGLLPFEIMDTVVIGRGADKPDPPHLDLSVLDAAELGVSRRHAMLRPTADHLFLIDLESLNGTFINGLRIIGKAQGLVTGDHISLGKLNMSVVLLELINPPEPSPKKDSEQPVPRSHPGQDTMRLPPLVLGSSESVVAPRSSGAAGQAESSQSPPSEDQPPSRKGEPSPSETPHTGDPSDTAPLGGESNTP